jgi:hypothetical protein
MARYLFLVCSFFLINLTKVCAQTSSENDYYVVIGAFAKLSDAEKVMDDANLKTFNAHYALHLKKQQYYVYLLQTQDQKKAHSFMKQIRKETKYKNARIYKGKLGEGK